MSATMSVTLQEWVLICMNRTSARLFRAERLRRRQDLALTVYLCRCFIAAIGIIASIIGTFFVSTKEGANAKIAFRLIKTRYIHCVNPVGSRLGVSDFYITSRQFKCILGGYFGTYRRSDDRIFHRVLHV